MYAEKDEEWMDREWELTRLFSKFAKRCKSVCIGQATLARNAHRCNPTTDRCGDFWLLRFRSDPVRPSLHNLDMTPSDVTPMLTPALVRTPDRHDLSENRTPDLKISSHPASHVARLQEMPTSQPNTHSIQAAFSSKNSC